MPDIMDFNRLTFIEKCTEITFKGKLLVKKELGNQNVFLFLLNNFYVEVWFNKLKKEIHGINSFQTSKGLELFLEDFSIEDLQRITGG